MKPIIRMLVGVLIAALGLSTLPVGARETVHAQAGTPQYEQAACMFTLPAGMVEGRDITCGYLTVPERYEDPQGPTIRLAVAIIKSKSPNPQPDPVFFAQGGPGGSTLDLFPGLLMDHPLRENHDLVLFDQRGTLYSQPKLACPEIFDETLKVLDKDLSDAESNQLYRQAADACRARLAGAGVELSAFHNLGNAQDVDSPRQALGYDQINFYGVSYGTLLALHVMREFPNGLRSVILDGVVPPQIDFNFEATRTIDGAFTQLFEACAADTDCNHDYPELEKVFFDQVAALDKQPVTISLSDPQTGKVYPALINGDALIQTLVQAIYSSELLPLLPKMIYDVRAGEYTLVERVLSIVTFDQTVMEGMYYSVICAEDGTYDPAKVDYTGIRPRLLKNENADSQAFSQLCADWNVTQIGAQADAPVVSSVPTLILNGRFDPVTPERYGKLVAQTLENSYVFTFPNTAHGAIGNECANQMMESFVNKPNATPDSACLGQQKLKFITSKDVIDFPVMIKALNLDVASLVQVGLMALLVLALLSAWVVYPLAWIVRVARGREGRATPPLGKLAPWVALLSGLVVLIYGVGLAIATANMVQANDMLILVGIAAKYRWVFVLPPIFTVLALGMLFLAAMGWSGKFWSGWRKVYYTLLALAAAGCVALMAVTGGLAGWMG